MNREALQPTPRCCPSHTDWPQLSQHLLVEFPNLPPRIVLDEVAKARSVVLTFKVEDADVLETGEILARHSLLITSGQAPDSARIDPERHSARIRQGAEVDVS